MYVHWPKQRCHLLRDDVVLVDSPGIDVSQVGPMACRASELLWLGLTACGGTFHRVMFGVFPHRCDKMCDVDKCCQQRGAMSLTLTCCPSSGHCADGNNFDAACSECISTIVVPGLCRCACKSILLSVSQPHLCRHYDLLLCMFRYRRAALPSNSPLHPPIPSDLCSVLP